VRADNPLKRENFTKPSKDDQSLDDIMSW